MRPIGLTRPPCVNPVVLCLAEAAAEFNRFNARKLELADATVADLRVGGNFRWSNAEGFARLLEQGAGAFLA